MERSEADVVDERIAELAALPSGWLNGEGRPISASALGHAALLAKSVSPRPGIYPMEDGGVQLEQDVPAGTWSVEVSPLGVVECHILCANGDCIARDFTAFDLATVVAWVQEVTRTGHALARSGGMRWWRESDPGRTSPNWGRVCLRCGWAVPSRSEGCGCGRVEEPEGPTEGPTGPTDAQVAAALMVGA